jgi:CubicO group peptidase (beta-lactamase class C family)
MHKKKEKTKFAGKVTVIFVLIGILGMYVNGFAQEKAAVIDKYLSACFDRELINGAVLVAEKGKIILKKAFGPANSEWDIPNSTDTKFYLYTLSQQFTAALVLKLVEEGKIKLNGTIRDYLPDYREDTGKKITIHHLLTHTHGLQDLEYTHLPLVNTFDVKEFIKRFLSTDPEFEPGKKFKFSTFAGYTLLAAIIEQVTGKTYEQVLHEKILKPVNMKNSGFIYPNSVLKKRASAYLNTTDERRTEFFRFGSNGATSLYATVDDLLLWDRALAGDTLLSEKTKKLMYQAHVPSSQSGSTGYGWNIVNLASDKTKKRVAWQTGAGYAAVWRVLDDDIVIISLNNKICGKLLEICIGVSNILFKRPGILPKRSFVNNLNKVVATEGIQAAIRKYGELRKSSPNEYNFEESELNILGDHLLSINKIAEAIEIFKLNLDVYPNSWYIYARLGEALVKGNNIEAAVRFFETAIKLMPRGEEQAYRDITAAIKQLKERQAKQPQNNQDTPI